MKKKRYVRLYTDFAKGLYERVEFSDGTKTIPVNILMTEQNIPCTRRGFPFECVIARGIEDFAKRNPERIPHEVLFVYVTRTAIYIVNKIKDGRFHHSYRYMHGFTKLTQTFDRMTKEAFAKKFDGYGFVLNLRPGRKHRAGESKDGGNGSGGSRSNKVSRGAMERAMAAGLLPQTANFAAGVAPE